MAEVFVSHLDWSGAMKGPARDPATFSRDLDVSFGAITLQMSAAQGYRGDATRANPEQLLVASLSACQALTYLYLAARNGISVVRYADDAEGHLALVDGKIRMARVKLRPAITMEGGANTEKARQLVEKAHQECFIANSVSTRVEIESSFEFAGSPTAAD
jgi:peroxiredoxin-like protein